MLHAIMIISFIRILTIALAGLLIAAGAASAHPHVWVTMKSAVVYGPDGSITGVRHAWTFDDMYSAFATQGLESKKKGEFTPEELKPLAKVNVESLKEYDFFTYAKANGKDVSFVEPVEYSLEFNAKDTVLTLHFVLPLKAPVKPKALALEVFDPAFFIDFKFDDKDPIKLVGAPAACQMKFQRPHDGTAAAQKLNEDNFASGDNSNYGAMFANKITVQCP